MFVLSPLMFFFISDARFELETAYNAATTYTQLLLNIKRTLNKCNFFFYKGEEDDRIRVILQLPQIPGGPERCRLSNFCHFAKRHICLLFLTQIASALTQIVQRSSLLCTLNWSNVKRYILLYMCFLIIFNHLLDSFLIRVWFVNEKGITSLVRVYSSIDIKRGCNTFWSFILQYFAFRLSVPFSAFTFHYVSALYNIFKDRPHSILKINQ